MKNYCFLSKNLCFKYLFFFFYWNGLSLINLSFSNWMDWNFKILCGFFFGAFLWILLIEGFLLEWHVGKWKNIEFLKNAIIIAKNFLLLPSVTKKNSGGLRGQESITILFNYLFNMFYWGLLWKRFSSKRVGGHPQMMSHENVHF